MKRPTITFVYDADGQVYTNTITWGGETIQVISNPANGTTRELQRADDATEQETPRRMRGSPCPVGAAFCSHTEEHSETNSGDYPPVTCMYHRCVPVGNAPADNPIPEVKMASEKMSAEWRKEILDRREAAEAKQSAAALQWQKAKAFDWLEAMFKHCVEDWDHIRIDPVNLEIVACSTESPMDTQDVCAETLLAAVQAAMAKERGCPPPKVRRKMTNITQPGEWHGECPDCRGTCAPFEASPRSSEDR